MTFGGGTGFTNPVIGGDGELVIDDIHSRGFVTGVSGWSVNRIGTAEFNNVTVRGDVAIGPSNGSQVLINTSPVFGAAASIQLPTHATAETRASGIYSVISLPGTPTENSVLTIESATRGAPADGEYMQLRLKSETKNGVQAPELEIHHVSGAGVFKLVAQFGIDDIYLSPDIPGGSTLRYLSADHPITNQGVLQNSNLNWALMANAVYEIDVWASFTSTVPGPASAATLVKTDWDAPVGTTGPVHTISATGTASGYTSATLHQMKTSGAAAFSTDIPFHLITGPQVIHQHGVLTTGATAGSWFFRFAQNTAQVGQTLTLEQGSTARVSRIA